MAAIDWSAPDYEDVYRERAERLRRLRRMTPEQRARVHRFYASNPAQWIEDWGTTSDPRQIDAGLPSDRPFILFPRQREFISFMHGCNVDRQDGVVEKTREVGISWCAIHYAVHAWLYKPGAVIGCGSYEADRVDVLGVMDSLLEKARFILRNLPVDLLPRGLDFDRHLLHKRLLNPANKAQIVGEIGDKIGRGGRATFYLIDEYAFLAHPDTVDGSLANTTECRIYISTANGLGSFFRKTQSEHFRQFRFEWRQDPRKNEAWYKAYRAKWGPTITAREVDIDHHASIEDLVIESAWVEAAKKVRAALIARGETVPSRAEFPRGVGGLDVGGGVAPSAFIDRHGPYVGVPETWKTGEGDTTVTAERGLRLARERRTRFLHFDAPGVGKGVASTLRHSKPEERLMAPAPKPAGVEPAPARPEETPEEAARRQVTEMFATIQPEGEPEAIPGSEVVLARGINTGVPATKWVVWPDGRKSSEAFVNLKAEIWWTMRQRFEATFETWLWATGQENGKRHPIEELIFLPSLGCDQLTKELIGPRWLEKPGGKIAIEGKKELAARGIPSPDEADTLALTFVPIAPQVSEGKLEGYF